MINKTALNPAASAVGGLFALAFAFIYGRIGALRARALSALMALMGFISFALVP
ncbi:CbtA family protein, partial [Chromobacterium piscinae]|uniref:CbtA family protein n=1 Tax=Chromobacterium piscinae TaxID=686831 RepID=UPI003D3316CC